MSATAAVQHYENEVQAIQAQVNDAIARVAQLDYLVSNKVNDSIAATSAALADFDALLAGFSTPTISSPSLPLDPGLTLDPIGELEGVPVPNLPGDPVFTPVGTLTATVTPDPVPTFTASPPDISGYLASISAAVSEPVPVIDTSGLPVYSPDAWALPAGPGAVTPGTVSAIFASYTPYYLNPASIAATYNTDDLSVTAAAPTAPTINYPDAPVLSNIGALPTPPDLQQFTLPTEPNINLQLALPTAPSIYMPAVPQLLDVTIPQAPDITVPDPIPAPNIVVPDVPDVQVNFTPARFDTTDVDALSATLRGWVENLQTVYADLQVVVAPPVAAKIDAEVSKAVADAKAEFSRAGFTRPQGVLDERLDGIRNDGLRKKAVALADLGAKLGELAQRWREVSLNNYQQLRNLARQALEGYQQLLLQVEQLKAKVATDLIRLRLEQVQSQINAYNALAANYKLQLDAVAAKIENFRALVDAARLVGQLNETSMRVYAEQIKGELAKLDVYRTELEAQRLVLDAEKTKIQVYAEQVRAYAEANQAEAVKFQVYEAQLKAYMAPLEVDKAKVEVYKATLAGEAAKVDVYDTSVKAFATLVNAQLEEFKAKLQQVETNNRAMAAQAEAASRLASANATQFSALVERDKAAASVAVDNERLRLDAHRSNIELYRAEVAAHEALTTKRVQEYSAAVEAYRAKLAAETTAIETYKAKLAGAAAIADAARASGQLFATQVDAYKAQVAAVQANTQAQAAAVDAEARQIEAQAKVNQSAAQAYEAAVAAARAQLDAYTAKARGYEARARASATALQAKATAYEATARAEASRVTAEATAADAKARVEATIAQGKSAALQGKIQASLEGFDIIARQLDAQRSILQTYVSGLVSAINYNVSLGHTASVSESYNRAVQSALNMQTVVEGLSVIPDGSWQQQITP